MRNDIRLQMDKPLNYMEPSEVVRLLKKYMINNDNKTLVDMIDMITDINSDYINMDSFINKIFGSVLVFYRWCKLTDELVTAILEDKDYSINHDAYGAILEIDIDNEYSNDYTFRRNSSNHNDSEYSLALSETIFLKEFRDKLVKLRELYADNIGIDIDIGLIVTTLGHNVLINGMRYW